MNSESKKNMKNGTFWNIITSKHRIAFSLSFGLLICVCAFLFWYSSDKTVSNEEAISGYMGKSETVIDGNKSYSTDLIGIQSSLGIFQKKDTLMVVMDKKSSENISVGYHYEPDYLTFIG